MKKLTLPIVKQASATFLPYPDNYFDAVFTDPPYYDNVPYSYLSDFFYVWLKRSIGDLYPELFTTPLTPKSKEIVAYSHHEGGFETEGVAKTGKALYIWQFGGVKNKCTPINIEKTGKNSLNFI